jgi:hypothetical protein
MPTSLPVELPQTENWSDTSIVCGDVKTFFAQTFHEDFDTRKMAVGIQVEIGSGTYGIKSSNVYSMLPAPLAPTNLGVEVR